MAGFPVRLDGPSQVALFAYDNNTFIAQSYRHEPADVTVAVAGKFNKLRNLVTGEIIGAEQPERDRHHSGPREMRTTFKVRLLPHSYVPFAAETGVLTAER